MKIDRGVLPLFAAVALLLVLAAGLVGAAPAGPGKDLVYVCHYSALHDQYNTLLVGRASAAFHLANHPADSAGPCTVR